MKYLINLMALNTNQKKIMDRINKSRKSKNFMSLWI